MHRCGSRGPFCVILSEREGSSLYRQQKDSSLLRMTYTGAATEEIQKLRREFAGLVV